MSNQQTVIMVPAKAVRQDLKTETNTIVYMPLATTKNPGVVKIGKGLDITADGLLSVDFNDDWYSSIRIDVDTLRTDVDNIKVNLDNVSLDLSELELRVEHIEDGTTVVEKARADQNGDNIVNTYQKKQDNTLVTIDKTVVGGINELTVQTQINGEDIRNAETNINNIQRNYATIKYVDNLYSAISIGGNKSYVFETRDQFIEWLDGTYTREDSLKPDLLKVGDVIFIEEMGVPDYWVKSKSSPMTINDFREYEAKIDIPEVTIDNESITKNENNELQAITLKNAFTNLKDVVSYSDFKGLTYLSEEQYQELIQYGSIVINGETIRYDEGTIYVTPEDTDSAKYVDLNTNQTITGLKTFTDSIYLANTDGTVDRIAHINNNFIVYSGVDNGIALLNIDEGLSKIYAFNKELAFKEDIPTSTGGGTTVYVGGVAQDSISVGADIQTQIDAVAASIEEKADKTVVDQNTVNINSLETIVSMHVTEIGALETAVDECVKYSETIDTSAANKIITLKDKDANNLYPVTLKSCIYDENNNPLTIGATVVDSYTSSDGATWYRVWSDGWKECGGVGTRNNMTYFPIAFTKSPTINLTYQGVTVNNITQLDTPIKLEAGYPTTESFIWLTYHSYSNQAYYYACGY